MELHNKIKILRKLKGLTQQNVSEQFYISRQAVQRWESGETSPDITKLLELSEMFNVSVDDLLNPDLNEQSLIKKALIADDIDLKKNPDIMSIIKGASTIDWILFSTTLFGTALSVILLHFVGILIVALSITLSLALAGLGLNSLVNMVIEMPQGIYIFLINIGTAMLGFALSFISYRFSIWFISTYIKFVKDVTLRFKDYGVFRGNFFMDSIKKRED